MTLPSSDAYLTYGGELENYSQVEDPQTDLDAEASNQLRASAAGITNTCFRAIVDFTIGDPGGITPILNQHYAVWDTVSSDPPVITYMSIGVYQIQFPNSVFDLRGASQDLNLLGSVVNVNVDNGNGFFATSRRNNATTFTVYMWSAVDASLEDIGGTNNSIQLFVR